MPIAKKGMLIECKRCGKDHRLETGKDDTGEESELIMFYHCDNKIYLGAVAGKLVCNVKPACSGKI
jgi:hypothetical protein